MLDVGGRGLETKFARLGDGITVTDGVVIEGYASVFWRADQGGDVVLPGAYAESLARRGAGAVKLLWQHDPREVIGIWDDIAEDATGLRVKGRLLPEIARGREAAALIGAGAIDGLSIGYRTLRASKDGRGRRLLAEVDLWEVSLVTFPMLPDARLAKGAEVPAEVLRRWAALLGDARRSLCGDNDDEERK